MAGAQGFDINVGGDTYLTGGHITSEAGAANRLSTQDLLVDAQDNVRRLSSHGHTLGLETAALALA